MVDPRYMPGGRKRTERSEQLVVEREIKRSADEPSAPAPGPRATWNLSEVMNDSATMAGTTAKDVFDAGAAAAGLTDTGAGSAGTGASGFARSDHVHDHGNLRGGSLHALASTLTHGFMSSTDKTVLYGVPMRPASLTDSQTIPTGYVSYLFGQLTIPVGVTLTIEGTGFLGIGGFTYNQAA